MPDEVLTQSQLERIRIISSVPAPSGAYINGTCYICTRGAAYSTASGTPVCGLCREIHLTPREETK